MSEKTIGTFYTIHNNKLFPAWIASTIEIPAEMEDLRGTEFHLKAKEHDGKTHWYDMRFIYSNGIYEPEFPRSLFAPVAESQIVGRDYGLIPRVLLHHTQDEDTDRPFALLNEFNSEPRNRDEQYHFGKLYNPVWIRAVRMINATAHIIELRR